MFFRFVSILVDTELKSLTEFCLVHLLLVRNSTICYHNFVECIFHFNDYKKHKGTCDFLMWYMCLLSDVVYVSVVWCGICVCCLMWCICLLSDVIYVSVVWCGVCVCCLIWYMCLLSDVVYVSVVWFDICVCCLMWYMCLLSDLIYVSVVWCSVCVFVYGSWPLGGRLAQFIVLECTLVCVWGGGMYILLFLLLYTSEDQINGYHSFKFIHLFLSLSLSLQSIINLDNQIKRESYFLLLVLVILIIVWRFISSCYHIWKMNTDFSWQLKYVRR